MVNKEYPVIRVHPFRLDGVREILGNKFVILSDDMISDKNVWYAEHPTCEDAEFIAWFYPWVISRGVFNSVERYDGAWQIAKASWDAAKRKT